MHGRGDLVGRSGRWCWLGLACAALGAAVGCGVAEPPEARDTLVFAAPADATVLDPHNTTDSQSDQVILMLFDTLITFDVEMHIVGSLAETWEVAEDRVTWTFYLRRGVTFHDGSVFDAEAVRANFERVLDPEQNHKRLPLFEMIDRVEVVDDYTVNIITAYPFGAFEPTMAHVSAAIVSPAVAAAHGRTFGRSAEATSGTGPYRVVRWTKDLEIVLERFDGYWGEAPPIRRVEYRPIPEAVSRVIALEAGDVDVITHIPPTDLARLQADPGIDIYKAVSIGAQQFRFNHAKEPFDDPRVVQAISYAIDRRAIVENLMPGLAEVSTGALTPIMRGYADLGEIEQDQAKARQLLAEAGYPDGFSTTISTTPRYLMGVELAEVLAAQLGQVGIRAEIDVLDWGSMVAFWEGLLPENNPQEIFIMGAGASTADADWGLRPIFMTHPTNENNYGYYSNAEFDRVIQEAMRETDAEARQALYRRAQEIVYLEDPGAIWLYDNYFIIGARADVTNITQSPLGVATFERAAFRE